VQSLEVPDRVWLAWDDGAPECLAAPGEPNPWVKEFSRRLAPSQVLTFWLRANPTVKRNGKRLDLYREVEQLEWIARKAKHSGFRLLSARTSDKRMMDWMVRRQSRQENLRLLSVQFDGLLDVRDPSRVRRTVENGIDLA